MGPTRLLGLALAVTLAGLTLALAAPAAAEHAKFRLAVTDDLVDPDTDLAGMGAVGVDVFRVVFSWRRAETSAGQVGKCDNDFDWSYQDALVAAANRSGVRLLPMIVGSPDYVGERPENSPATGSPAIRDYACYLQALVGRYGRGGDFIQLLRASGQGARPVTAWQVWNEPNMRQFATSAGIKPREYARLVKVTHRKITSVDPRAKIILAGLPERLQSARSGARRYLRRFYRVKRIERKFDAVALHPYAENRRGVKGALIRVRRLLRRVGDGRRPLWITEVGWSTHGPKGSFLVKSEQGQARQLKRTVAMLKRKRKRFRLGTVSWFRWRDIDTPGRQTDSRVFRYAGLYRENGRPKPSCRRYGTLAGGRCPTLASRVTASSRRPSGADAELGAGRTTSTLRPALPE